MSYRHKFNLNAQLFVTGSVVTFGSIDDVSAPISSSPAATPAIKAESVKSFGSVPATTNQINGKTPVSTSKPPAQSTSTSASSTPSVSTPPPRIGKMDIAKMFQNPSTAAPSPPTTSDTNSPSMRPSGLPNQQSHSSSSQPGLPPSSTPSPFGAHSFTPFVPQNGMRPPQQNSGPGGGPGPRSPVYSRQQMPNGNGARPQGGPNGPNGQPQMSSGLSSPRLAPMPHPGQPSGMPPPQMQPQMWPGYYVRKLSVRQ